MKLCQQGHKCGNVMPDHLKCTCIQCGAVFDDRSCKRRYQGHVSVAYNHQTGEKIITPDPCHDPDRGLRESGE